MRRIRVLAILMLTAIIAGCAALPEKGGGSKTEFPAFVYASATSLEAFRFAVAQPELLQQLPCYCGCANSQPPHTDLKMCFIKPDGSFNDHASTCDLCAKEALDAKKWQAEGKDVKEIRTLIENKYSEYGPGTNTPPIG